MLHVIDGHRGLSGNFAGRPVVLLSTATYVSDCRSDGKIGFDDLEFGAKTPGPVNRMDENHAAFRMYMLGPFSLVDGKGKSVAPRSQKAQAILAMLALSARGSRSRVWLRDKLWSDRSEDQAAASLRQALLDIHKALGSHRGLIIADKNTVWLDVDRVALDTDEVLRTERAADKITDELLEGIDIRDPEFEDWLTVERQNWYRRLEEGRVDDVFVPRQQPRRDIERHSALLPVTGVAEQLPSNIPPVAAGTETDKPPSPDNLQWTITLRPPIVVGAGDGAQIAALQYQNLLAKAIFDGLGLGVTDLFIDPNSGQPDGKMGLPLCLQLRLTFDGSMVLIELAIKHLLDNRIMWLGSRIVGRTQIERAEFGVAAALISQAVDQLSLFQEINAGNGRMTRDGLYIDAVNSIFRLSRNDLEAAERRLKEEIEYQPRPSAFAWLSFIRTFQVGQRFTALDTPLIDEAEAYARKALELDPNNSVSLALVGHVHSFLFREYDYAAGLFEKSIRLNSASPLGWDLYAILHCFAGQPEKASAMARWVQDLSVYSAHKYYFDTTKSISASLAGDHIGAIEAGEDALRARPNFNSLLRYLASSHAHAGNLDAARHYLERLDTVENGFSITAFRDSGYPLLSTGGGKMLINGLIKAGARTR
jgi:tetratricopeptide (TPR) repeat protein